MLPAFKSIMLTLLSYQIGAVGRETSVEEAKRSGSRFLCPGKHMEQSIGGNYLGKGEREGEIERCGQDGISCLRTGEVAGQLS